MKCHDIRSTWPAVSVFAACLLVAAQTGQATSSFSEPKNLGAQINTPYSDGTPCISYDGLNLFFTSNRPGGSGMHDLWVAERTSLKDPWDAPANVGAQVNSSAMDYFPCVSADGLELCFYSTRSGGSGGGDLWLSKRAGADSPWSNAANLGSKVNSSSEDVSPNLSADRLTLLFSSDRAGGYGSYDIYVATRPSVGSQWSLPTNLGPAVNTSSLEAAPCISSDGLVLFFHSTRSGSLGSYDLYYSRRSTPESPWSTPVNLGSPVNSMYSELGPSLSGDGRLLYFSDHYTLAPRPGGFGVDDIWEVAISPAVDYDGTGYLDFRDFATFARGYSGAEAEADICPMPFGDGVVDERDMALLAEYWLADFSLVAQWRLDETEGDIAFDSVGENDAALHGGPVWQSTSAVDGGALELDGIDDYLSTPFTLNPAAGSFSVFVWIRTAAPGRVIVSQLDMQAGRVTYPGATWLGTDPSDGRLVTRLMETPYGALESDCIVCDDSWHHVGLVYDCDASQRRLYADGLELAKDDAAVGGIISGGALYIGAGRYLWPAEFYSGRIDDIRIYDRAVAP